MKSLAVKVFVILVGVCHLSGLTSHTHYITAHGKGIKVRPCKSLFQALGHPEATEVVSSSNRLASKEA